MYPPRPAPVRLADSIAHALEKRVLEGSLKPGDRLPSEREFALELGVSRPSLREAMHKLVSKGLLTTRHGGGTFVTDRLQSHFVDPWQDMLKGNPALHVDLLEFRQMLEGEAAMLAADRATDVDLSRLDAAYASLEEAYTRDVLSDCIDTDVAFHQVIAESAHNLLIAQLTASLMKVIEGHVSTNLMHLHTRPQRWQALRKQHQAIWLAIREHNPEQAGLAAKAHIEFVRQHMETNARDEERRQLALRRIG